MTMGLGVLTIRFDMELIRHPFGLLRDLSFPTPYDSADSVGQTYHDYRHQIMLTRQEGLTKTYNRFHNPDETAADIQRLRDLHVEMDNAVAAAYGWTDLDLGHGFHETKQGIRFTISEPPAAKSSPASSSSTTSATPRRSRRASTTRSVGRGAWGGEQRRLRKPPRVGGLRPAQDGSTRDRRL